MLLTDSLILEASQHLRGHARLEAALMKLRGLSLALKDIRGEAALAVAEKVARVLAEPNVDVAERVVAEARAAVETASREAAAAARRRVVLQSLSELGYDVRESMATAWAEQGRVVVRKPGMQDYGVELGAPRDATRIQVRLVGAERPQSPRNVKRDKDHEVAWCSDFGRLGEFLKGVGAEMVTERAGEAGA